MTNGTNGTAITPKFQSVTDPVTVSTPDPTMTQDKETLNVSFVCPDCKKECATKAALASHRRNKHGVQGKRKLPATLHPKKKSLKKRSAPEVFACEEPGCGREFGSLRGLKRHMYVHLEAAEEQETFAVEEDYGFDATLLTDDQLVAAHAELLRRFEDRTKIWESLHELVAPPQEEETY